MTAPLLDRSDYADPPTLPYQKWAAHYNECVTCQRDEWYSPLLGEPFFCDKGKELFRAWVKAAGTWTGAISRRKRG